MPRRGAAGFASNTMLPGPRPNLRTKWHLDLSSRLATINMGRKVRAVPLFRGARSPSSTMLPGPRPTSTPSGILILDLSSRLAPIAMGRKLGDVPPF